MAVSSFQVAEILVGDPSLIDKRNTLADKLINYSDKFKLDLKLKQTYDITEWFQELIEIWISGQQLQQSSVRNLCDILKQCKFNNCAGVAVTVLVGFIVYYLLKRRERRNTNSGIPPHITPTVNAAIENLADPSNVGDQDN